MKISYFESWEAYLARVAEITVNPLTYGLHKAIVEGLPLGDELEKFLKECFEHHVPPEYAVEQWIE